VLQTFELSHITFLVLVIFCIQTFVLFSDFSQLFFEIEVRVLVLVWGQKYIDLFQELVAPLVKAGDLCFETFVAVGAGLEDSPKVLGIIEIQVLPEVVGTIFVGLS
jgi:hypothetical protein